MTTKEEQIAAIRQKCIEANPEIGKQEVNSRTNIGRMQGIVGWEPRPIRLSDVLQACMDTPVNTEQMEAIMWKWFFRQDDLTQQADETIEFIHSLVCS